MSAKGSDTVFLDEWTTRNLKHARCFCGLVDAILWSFGVRCKIKLIFHYVLLLEGMVCWNWKVHFTRFFGEHVATTTFCGWIPQVVVWGSETLTMSETWKFWDLQQKLIINNLHYDCQIARGWINNYTLENERTPPENQWLEDVFPTKIVPF